MTINDIIAVFWHHYAIITYEPWLWQSNTFLNFSHFPFIFINICRIFFWSLNGSRHDRFWHVDSVNLTLLDFLEPMNIGFYGPEPVLDQVMIHMVRFWLSRHVLFQVCQSLLNHVPIFERKPQHARPKRVYCQKCRWIELVKGFKNRQKMALKCFKINFIINCGLLKLVGSNVRFTWIPISSRIPIG